MKPEKEKYYDAEGYDIEDDGVLVMNSFLGIKGLLSLSLSTWLMSSSRK